MSADPSRRAFLTRSAGLGAAALAAPFVPSPLLDLDAPAVPEAALPSGTDERPITTETIATAEILLGLRFTPEQRALMLEDVQDRREALEALRAAAPDNAVAPALVFDPKVGGEPVPEDDAGAVWSPEPNPAPLSGDDLAFAGVAKLASLLHARRVTSVELTRFFLDRLRTLDGRLEAVITLTEERALAQASALDAEALQGRFRGPLHGIPWGAKDLLAVEGYPTTWGAAPFRDQTLEGDAAVVERLDRAGAVLVAKLTLGALAWGDVWFGGTTKNPWNLDQGSSGSSAGPGSAVSAGAVPFAIGSETLGSIVSPSTRNGVTGHRPTFGAVSRHGAMALAWSMDKLGPMARSALDCALVYDAIRGADPRDPHSGPAPFDFDPEAGLQGLRIGLYASAFEGEYAGSEADRAALDVLRELGASLQPVELPADEFPVGAMGLILTAEAGAAFSALTLSGGADALTRQVRFAWPNTFRHARFIPAVEYLEANRLRTLLMRRMAEVFRDVDVIVAPSFRGSVLQITNLTGHPAVAVPHAFDPVEGSEARRNPRSITFLAGLWRDGDALRVAHAFQQATDFDDLRPSIQ